MNNRSTDKRGWLVIPKETLEENRGEWNFCERLRAARTVLNLSQREVAGYLHIDRSTYSYYEIGKSEPSLKVMRGICRLFNVSPEFFLDLERD